MPLCQGERGPAGPATVGPRGIPGIPGERGEQVSVVSPPDSHLKKKSQGKSWDPDQKYLKIFTIT